MESSELFLESAIFRRKRINVWDDISQEIFSVSFMKSGAARSFWELKTFADAAKTPETTNAVSAGVAPLPSAFFPALCASKMAFPRFSVFGECLLAISLVEWCAIFFLRRNIESLEPGLSSAKMEFKWFGSLELSSRKTAFVPAIFVLNLLLASEKEMKVRNIFALSEERKDASSLCLVKGGGGGHLSSKHERT